VKWQIGKVYFQVLRGRYQLALEEEDIRRYQSIYTISSALTSTGINAGVDSSLAKAELSRTRINYNRATGNLVRLQQQLAYLTGVSNPQIRMDSGAGMTPEERMGLMDGVVPGNGAGMNPMNGFRPGMDTGRFNGLGAGNANPLADYFAKQKLQYQAEELLIRKSYLPKIILGAGGWARGSSIQYSNDYKSLGEGMGYQRLNYMGGLGITYDLFNGVRKKDRLTVAGYQSAAADLALQQQVLTLRNEELQADETIRIAQKNLAELPVQLQAATDAYNQKLAQYKAGIINLVDLSNASFILYQAQSAYIETLNEWYTANLDKAAATGNLDQFIQTLN
jgi:outer membrane protein TolC